MTTFRYHAKSQDHYDIDPNELYLNEDRDSDWLSYNAILCRVSGDDFIVILGSCQWNNGIDKHGNSCAGLCVGREHLKKIEVHHDERN